jgi:hypothetical protein
VHCQIVPYSPMFSDLSVNQTEAVDVDNVEGAASGLNTVEADKRKRGHERSRPTGFGDYPVTIGKDLQGSEVHVWECDPLKTDKAGKELRSVGRLSEVCELATHEFLKYIEGAIAERFVPETGHNGRVRLPLRRRGRWNRVGDRVHAQIFHFMRVLLSF